MLRLAGREFAMYPTQIQFGWPNPVRLASLFTVDRQLLWVPKSYNAQVAAWKDKRPTIVFMGDSCTQGAEYPEFLASLIEERNSEREFIYVTVGVRGWNSYQGLRQLERILYR